MTKEEIFNQVKTHLLNQGERSRSDTDWDVCAYRGTDGTKCAVGCLISDEEYKVEMEGETVKSLQRDGLLPERLKPFVSLLSGLQQIHDYYPERSWATRLDKLENNLEYY